MELSFTELDANIDTNIDTNTDSYKTYYDGLTPQTRNNNNNKTPPITYNKRLNKPKKKTISYDDILSSMNTIVIDGKLEFIRKDRLQPIIDNHLGQKWDTNKKKVTFNQGPQQQIDRSSYIYNKYFKDYKDQTQDQIEEPRRPLTKNEMIKQVIINKVNAINERNRIAEIKSTKLLFNNNNNTNIVINSRYIPQNPSGIAMNHLFRFK
jgi:hypothetical protein